MITLANFYMGRDVTHASELTPELQANAADMVDKVNQLIAAAALDGVKPGVDTATRSAVGSGWRPAGVNAATANSAKNSPHMVCNACDIRDDLNRSFAKWACTVNGRDALKRIGLWCERPQWTPSWLHVQRIAPKSGNLFFIPSSAPAMASPLPNEGP